MTEKTKHPLSEESPKTLSEEEATAVHDDPGTAAEAKKPAPSVRDHSQDADRHSKLRHPHSQK